MKTYIVRLHEPPAAGEDSGQLRGVVHEVRTGRQATFISAAQLVRLLAGIPCHPDELAGGDDHGHSHLALTLGRKDGLAADVDRVQIADGGGILKRVAVDSQDVGVEARGNAPLAVSEPARVSSTGRQRPQDLGWAEASRGHVFGGEAQHVVWLGARDSGIAAGD